MINVVIPMAGLGSRFAKAGFTAPKPFIDVAGKPMIVRVLENLSCPEARYILIARTEHLDRERELVEAIQRDFNVILVPIDRMTEGAACTVLFAREYINNREPLVIANSDQIVDVGFRDYVGDCLQRRWDGSIMIFKDPHKDTKWSFARLDTTGRVLEVREKVPISDAATVGIYMFSEGRFFVDAAIDMIARNDRVNNEFYLCPVYNYAIGKNRIIGTYEIGFSRMHGLGTPEDLSTYLTFIKAANV